MSAAVQTPTTGILERASRLAAPVLAILLGMLFLYGTGIVQANALHNAAHDARHAFAFPCH